MVRPLLAMDLEGSQVLETYSTLFLVGQGLAVPHGVEIRLEEDPIYR